jgi:hypothetical protein
VRTAVRSSGLSLVAGVCLALAAAASRSGPLHLSLGHGLIRASPPPRGRHPSRANAHQVAGSGHAAHWLVEVGLGVAAVLALLTVIGLLRLLRHVRLGEIRWRLRREPFAPPPPTVGTDDALAARSIEAALAELETGDSPRAAVIAAYAAMVGALADSGTPGAAALTPMRLLARSADVLQGDDAPTLTALFERARFSEHPVTEADRADAQARLSAVRARLSVTVTA